MFAPGLIAAVETIDPGKSEIGEDLRIILAGVAMIAIDQDRLRLRRALDHVRKIGQRDVARIVDSCALEGVGVANVEHERAAGREERPRLINSNALKRNALRHRDLSFKDVASATRPDRDCCNASVKQGSGQANRTAYSSMLGRRITSAGAPGPPPSKKSSALTSDRPPPLSIRTTASFGILASSSSS